MTESRPFTAASFNRYLSEGKLMASYCPDSDRLYLPPRAICPQTYSDRMEWRALSGRGTLAAFTSIYVGPAAMNAEGYDRDNPYCTGIVALEEGVSISAFLLGVDARNPEAIVTGTPLAVDFVERGDGEARRTYLAFRPLPAAAS